MAEDMFEGSTRWPRRSCGTAGGAHSQFNRVARQRNERSGETLGFETRAERDLMLVLHRPIEPTTQSGHRLLAKLLSTLDSPPACIMECKSFGGDVSPSHFGPRIQIRGNTYWRVSFGWVPNLQRGSLWLRRKPAQVGRLIRRAQNSSIRFRKCAVTGWRAQRPKSNSASNCRKN